MSNYRRRRPRNRFAKPCGCLREWQSKAKYHDHGTDDGLQETPYRGAHRRGPRPFMTHARALRFMERLRAD